MEIILTQKDFGKSTKKEFALIHARTRFRSDKNVAALSS